MVIGYIIITFLAIYLLIDYSGPAKISIRPFRAFGFSCLRATDLIVQEYDRKGNLWATRGMLIYRMKNGESHFTKAGRVPSGFSIFWLNNFKITRIITLRSECVEMVVDENGSMCAFSAGKIWNCSGIGHKFHRTYKLPHFGRKVGRGVMSSGLAHLGKSGFLLGEYFDNPEKIPVKIFTFQHNNGNWNITHEFKKGHIRHIHSLQKDPYSPKLWVCTGDDDNEALIGWSEDNFKTIVPIGEGGQKWRACHVIFTKEAVYWGADTGSNENAGIYRWDRDSRALTKLASISGAIFYGTRMANGTIIMSTDREGFPNETDDKTSLIIVSDEAVKSMVECGSWKHRKPGFRFNFAKLRFQRSQGDKMLAVSCLNLREYKEATLFIIPEGSFDLLRYN